VRIDTLGGLVVCSDAGAGAVTADMGVPRLQWQDIPLATTVDTRAFALPVDGESLTATALSMGNPHCVIFVDNAERAPVADLGARIEKLPLFPERTNVEL